MLLNGVTNVKKDLIRSLVPPAIVHLIKVIDIKIQKSQGYVVTTSPLQFD